jgi:peptide methionine sulfoxide reductase MsrB
MLWWTLAATALACLQSELRFRAKETLGKYAWVCCDNDVYTEPKGSFATTDIFETVNNETIFYDAKCGIPLFQLGKRELVNWTASSIAHGWPSFRDSEVYTFDNLRVTETGEVVSKCGTHLGRTMPDSLGRFRDDRYSINMLCISGYEGKMGASPKSPSLRPHVTKKVLYPETEAVSAVWRLAFPALLVLLLC